MTRAAHRCGAGAIALFPQGDPPQFQPACAIVSLDPVDKPL
jgi:hypothetical protein